MNSPFTLIGYGLALVLGFSTYWTADDIITRPSDSLTPAIKINEITIRDDGTTVYDRVMLAGPVWQAWAGVIYGKNGEIHCEGGDLAKYTGPLDDPAEYDVNWLVGDDCTGIEAGMKFYFTWTPMGPDYRPVRYPAEGYGTVLPANEPQPPMGEEG